MEDFDVIFHDFSGSASDNCKMNTACFLIVTYDIPLDVIQFCQLLVAMVTFIVNFDGTFP